RVERGHAPCRIVGPSPHAIFDFGVAREIAAAGPSRLAGHSLEGRMGIGRGPERKRAPRERDAPLRLLPECAEAYRRRVAPGSELVGVPDELHRRVSTLETLCRTRIPRAKRPAVGRLSG